MFFSSNRTQNNSIHTDQIYRTINQYYNTFVSYRGAISPTSLPTILSIIGLFGFIAALVSSLTESGILKTSYTENVRLFITLFFEVLSLASWFAIQIKRDKLAIKRAQHDLGSNATDLLQLKSLWLSKHIPGGQSNFLKLAKEIDEVISIKEKYKSSFSIHRREIFDLIFSNDSKNRVLGMFMGLCAILTALLIADGARIEILFALAETGELKKFLYLVPAFAFILLATAVMMKFSLNFVLLIVDYFMEFLDGVNSKSMRRTKLFVNELIRFHTFRKPRVRVTAELGQSVQAVDNHLETTINGNRSSV